MPLDNRGNYPKPNFTALTPAGGGYANYSSPAWAAMGYFKDAMGFIHLRGLYKFVPSGAYGALDPTSMPAGLFSPSERPIFCCIAEYAGGPLSTRFDVINNGILEGTPGSGVSMTGGYASMSGVEYSVI